MERYWGFLGGVVTLSLLALAWGSDHVPGYAGPFMKLISGLIMMGWGAFVLAKTTFLVEATIKPLPISGSENDPYFGAQSYKDYQTATRIRIIASGVFISLLGALIAVGAFIPR